MITNIINELSFDQARRAVQELEMGRENRRASLVIRLPLTFS